MGPLAVPEWCGRTIVPAEAAIRVQLECYWMTPRPVDRRLRACVAIGLSSNAALTAVVALDSGSLEVDMPGWLAITASVAAAMALLGFAAGLYELFALPGDRSGAGHHPVAQSVILASGSLMLALFAATALGRDTAFTTLAVATLLLVHLAATRFIPAVGLLVQAAVVAGLMLIPDWRMDLPVAVWVAMTITLLTVVGVYRLANQRPKLSIRGVAVVVGGWVFMSAVILGLRKSVGLSIWPAEFHMGSLVWPMLGVLALCVAIRWRLAGVTPDARAASGVVRVVALGQPLMAAAWCVSVELMGAAISFLIVAVAATMLSGLARDLASFHPAHGPHWRR